MVKVGKKTSKNQNSTTHKGLLWYNVGLTQGQNGMKKRSPSYGQNGQLVYWWVLVHSGPMVWPK